MRREYAEGKEALERQIDGIAARLQGRERLVDERDRGRVKRLAGNGGLEAAAGL